MGFIILSLRLAHFLGGGSDCGLLAPMSVGFGKINGASDIDRKPLPMEWGPKKKKRAVVSAVVEMGLAAKTTWLFLKQKYLFIGKMSRIFSRIWSPRHLWKFQLCGTDSFL